MYLTSIVAHMWDVGDMGCLGCGMLGDVGCWGYAMLGMCNVGDVGCWFKKCLTDSYQVHLGY